MTLGILKQMANGISIQFGSDCEVVIHDLTKKSIKKSIVFIANGHITGRKKGDGPSYVVLETLKKDPKKIKDHLGYLTKTADGKTLKSSTIFIRDEKDGPIKYIFSINHDITNLLYLQESINALVSKNAENPNPEERNKEPEKIQTNVADLLDELIAQSVKIIGKPASLMNKDEKIEAIRFLNDSGAFLITKSGDKVSKYFNISKYTLYSYIKTE
ncbi:MAG: helix-turn-helix transcriptional regulator [Lachnospiraceae bacterium]|jgi:predicted transcriptional regulator YheO|nr:helix-turn-helix transcriptional regulator [Lachnospiraceae bacterium]